MPQRFPLKKKLTESDRARERERERDRDIFTTVVPGHFSLFLHSFYARFLKSSWVICQNNVIIKCKSITFIKYYLKRKKKRIFCMNIKSRVISQRIPLLFFSSFEAGGCNLFFGFFFNFFSMPKVNIFMILLLLLFYFFFLETKTKKRKTIFNLRSFLDVKVFTNFIAYQPCRIEY